MELVYDERLCSTSDFAARKEHCSAEKEVLGWLVLEGTEIVLHLQVSVQPTAAIAASASTIPFN